MKKPLVGIVMGSDSDLPVMQQAAIALDQFSIGYEMTVVSAHRTPKRLAEYVDEAQKRGIKVLIAGSGGAAHLPGMIAAHSVLPVIGVPVALKELQGLDALFSIVQMPIGVPVATVCINGGKNAGILAAQILSTGNPALVQKFHDFKAHMEADVLKKSEAVEETSFEKYLQGKGPL
jgi:5-(carboxyamino)imidazole ribonucleotide mutase